MRSTDVIRRKARYERTLLALTTIVTATGCEDRVVEWIQHWVSRRRKLRFATDKSGNVTVRLAREPRTNRPPIYIVAHLDHPAFVVESTLGAEVRLEFRGGVRAEYFIGSVITIHTASGPVEAWIQRKLREKSKLGFDRYLAEIRRVGRRHEPMPGDVATWKLTKPHVDSEGILHTNVCDNLANVAAALVTIDRLQRLPWEKRKREIVRVVFTRAEEIGFVGANEAIRNRTIKKRGHVIVLENSRELPHARVGDGVVIRAGDRLSVFSYDETVSMMMRAEELSGRTCNGKEIAKIAKPALPRWQYQLMTGGACEATLFMSHRFGTGCLVLPVRNYHNMADLVRVEKGKVRVARPGLEAISLADFAGMVELLFSLAQSFPKVAGLRGKLSARCRQLVPVLG